ncbi:NAD dehydrogenase [Coprinopsis cinerea okayama7|uniref:L-2-hydroxyglutarate dehydrogenase, mitochondrial n=1 Tax=Coprinopsis cinerea (strain Okayama-7 / 130 / ATCC MYA-4618 / FGSC 9003) TaxID=240176 RepID=A8NYA8_COPC7|nr:NAD dehydrogenase [Coprinopsis cinerea okayama7\|eukprot:XP_001837383.1 NAD dehydrogenase [Coprinopsis cinerea okayama7\
MKAIRGLKRALNDTGRYRYKSPELAVDHVVIGGGIVGLAIAQRLCQQFPSKSTYLIERHPRAGEEISSRNSEVIHSGLYYPEDSWKTKLCIRGRDLMYQRCKERNIPYRQTGKLVVASHEQLPYIHNLHQKSLRMKWPEFSLAGKEDRQDPVLPTELISGEQAREMESDLSKDIVGALWVPTTGIVDSHTFMQSLEKDIVESEQGQVAYGTRVVRLDPYIRSKRPANIPDTETGWILQTVTGKAEETDSILARTVINAAGLSSTFILNALLPQDQRIPMYYAKGSYAKYKGPGVSNVSHLIYPCPETGPTQHAFQSLGTHLTLDLDGNIRFGPDLQWIPAPDTFSDDPEQDTDFWMEHLTPDESQIAEMHQVVTQYLPGVTLDGLQPDYVGMRPKLIPPSGGFQDFVLRIDHPIDADYASIAEFRPMISLLGIESPGLTSSLAIAEQVVTGILKGGKTEV